MIVGIGYWRQWVNGLKVGQWIKRLVGYFWHLLAVAIIAVAVIVQLGRGLSPLVNDLRPTITDYLSQHFGAKITMEELQIAWQDLQLQLIVEQLTISRAPDDIVLQVDHANLQLDMLSSLLQRRLIWRHVVLHDIYIHTEQNNAGIWNLAGFSRNASDQPMNIQAFDFSDLFVLSEQVELHNADFLLSFRTGQSVRLSVPSVTIENDDDFHRLQASADIDGDNRILYFIVEGVGDPRHRDTFSANGFLQLKKFPVGDLMAALPKKLSGDDDNTWHRSGHIDLQLWIDFLKPNQFAVQGNFTANDIQLTHRQKPIVIAESIDSLFSGAIDLEGESSLSLNRVNIDTNDQITLPNVNLRSSADDIAIQVDQIDVAPWIDWLIEKPFLKDTVKQVLTRLSPVGTLKNVALMGKINDWQSFRLRSNIVDTAIAAWKKVPSFKGIDGYIETTMRQGVIDLETNNFHFFPETLFDNALQLGKTKGQISWYLRPQQNSIIVNSGPLHSDGAHGQMHGAFYMDIPWTPRTRPSHFILQVGLQNADVKDYRFFLPKKLPAKLQTWLAKSIDGDSGKIPTAGFIYNGPFSQKRRGERSIQLFADISQAALTYHPRWPSITELQGQLVIDNGNVIADIKRAKIYDATVSDTTVHWLGPTGKGDSIRKLHIKGSAKGPTASGLRLLQESWLSTKVGTVFDHWIADGDLEADLTLALPLLNTDMAPNYSINVKLNDSTIDMQQQNLPFHNVNGALEIDSRKGVSSPGINATLWEYPLTITLKNDIQQASNYLSIGGRGRTDMKSVARWLRRPALLFASGETDFSVQMQIPLSSKHLPPNKPDENNHNVIESVMEEVKNERAGNFTLSLQSDLTGIDIDLPEPFAKKASDQLPLHVQLSANSDTREYDIRFGRLGQLLFMQENGEVAGAVFRYHTDDIELKRDKFLVAGHIETLNIDQWQTVIPRYHHHQKTLAEVQKKSDVPDFPDIEFDWSFDTVNLKKTVFKNIYATANRKTDHWQININSINTVGTISLFDNKRPTKLHFEKLHWPQTKTTEEEAFDKPSEVAVDSWADTDLSAIPPLDFSIDKLIALDKVLGQWKFKLRPINNGKGIELNDIYGNTEGLNFTGNDGASGGYFRWDQDVNGSKRSQSQLIGVLKGGDIKPLLDKWQLSPLESKESYIGAQLIWEGSPRVFAVNKLVGDVTLSMDNGRFFREQNNEATDILRLFGLFNFDTWARRIRLDFSDLYKSGLSFDRLEGEIEFDKGIIYLTKPLVVKAPSSDLKMAGKIDYERRQIDTTLVATLPVSGNLTLGIALAAGLPAAAGVYVISKIFKSQVDKVASLSYSIKGNWENPEIRFDKLFDKKAANKAGQTAEREKQAENQPSIINQSD